MQERKEYYAEAAEDFQRVDQVGGAGINNLDILMAKSYLGMGDFELAVSFRDLAARNVDQLRPADRMIFKEVSQQIEEALAEQ